ncbi:MAG: class I SAM-dependent methyltransferase [Dehalococcoidia bacterium]|nr:class I SAM-dependent methyltransferase [Dehalococcoidia bacterium]
MTTSELAARAAAALARELALRLAPRIAVGELVVELPDGSERGYGTPGAGPRARLRIRDERFFLRLLSGGEIGFGEAYTDGLCDTDDLVALLELAIANRAAMTSGARWLGAIGRLRDVRQHRRRRNTKANARRNIAGHYDLSNDFFALWLDETMTYSCAVFGDDGESLADAQRNKYEAIARRAGIRRGDHVLEIGSGWGGFAIYAAQAYGCRVTSITISREQHALARERVEAAGLSQIVDMRLSDYRELRGQYDRIVSIEMFEAVGAEYFSTFFEACERLLAPGGRMAMQVITVPDRSFLALRDGVNWMQKHIFPGGMLPSLAALEAALATTQLRIVEVADIGAHYAETLRRWRAAFRAQLPAVRALGFDERFTRMWEYYLAACEAGFRTRNTSDVQIVFEGAPAAAPGVTLTPPARRPSPATR